MPSVHPAAGVFPEVSTHESDPGDGGSAGGGGGGAPNAKDVDVLKKGDTLGRYLVLERLGAGAMGVVYAAYDPELDRKIAIKILRPHEGKGDPARRQERLVREAKAMAKLSHPNVGAIYDVGVHANQVFLAMEFLSGGTLRDWMTAKKRPWREVVKMFIEVGKGLAGAHAEGLIHRDFKPDNVLLDKNGVPKVVDFGLVRLTSAAIDRSTTGSMDVAALDESTEDDDAASLPVAQTALAALTRTGALTGTPAYMAPEQFLGKPIDARTDQFAFCIALYEALYGERPFAGQTVIGLAESVTEGRMRAVPTSALVPPWIRRVVIGGLRTNPNDRYSSLDALLSALTDDPVLRRQKRIRAFGTVLAIVAALVGTRYWFGRRQRELDRQVSASVQSAETLLAKLPPLTTRFEDQRRVIMELFDSGNPRAELEWKRAQSAWTEIDRLANSAFAALDTARALRPSVEVDAQLTQALLEHARRNQHADHYSEATAILGRLPQPTAAGTFLTGSVAISTKSYPSTVAIFRYEKSPTGSLTPTPIATIDLDGATTRPLVQGSYLFRFSAPNKTSVDYPLFLRIGEAVTLSIALPPAGTVPAGFTYVPAGRFLTGDADESLRTGFTNAAPLHERSTPGFLIANREVTFAEWMTFLRALPRTQVAALLPRTSESVFRSLTASVDLQPSSVHAWRLNLTPVTTTYTAVEGEPIVYPGREVRARQDWSRMPVAGIAANDVTEYAAWLERTKRLPGARLCYEEQWERAARGADDRRYPHGDTLAAGDANHDVTYGRISTAFGPDEVGSYPASRSPFGLDDMAGNVWEVVTSHVDRNAFVLRGGAYYHFENTELVTNREPFTESSRSAHVGARICADLPPTIEPSQFRVQRRDLE